MADLLAGVDIEDLCAAVATGRDEAAIMTEANTAHDTLMRQAVNQIDIKSAVHTWVEHSEPVLALTLEVRWKLVDIVLRKLVADLLELRRSVLKIGGNLDITVWWRSRASDLWRARVGRSWVLLRSGWSTESRRTSQTRLAGTWRSCWLGWLLRTVAIYSRWTLDLTVREWVVWWTWRRIEARRHGSLHMTRHARLALLLLWGRGETRATSTTSHDALEEIGWTVANGWWCRLRGRRVRALRWTSSLLELVAETGDFLLVSSRG
jgi:hypothetical protein